MNVEAIERRLRSELGTIHARLRSWHEREREGEVVAHRQLNFVDAAQQTTVVETLSSDAARLADRARRLVQALGRLHDGQYGICEACDHVIPPARLLAVPDAELCLACQRAQEHAAGRPWGGDEGRRPQLVATRGRRRRRAIEYRDRPRRDQFERERWYRLAG